MRSAVMPRAYRRRWAAVSPRGYGSLTARILVGASVVPMVATMDPAADEIWLPGQAVVRSTAEGTVTVEGAVHSFAEHEAALRAAWRTPGVRRVHDLLSIRI